MTSGKILTPLSTSREGLCREGLRPRPLPSLASHPPPRSHRASCSGDTQLLGQKTKGLTEVQATRVPRRGTGGLRRRTSLRPWRKNLLEPVSTCLEEPPKKYGAQGRVRSHWGGPGLTRAGICLRDPLASGVLAGTPAVWPQFPDTAGPRLLWEKPSQIN